jgi:HKD family nuclease
MKIKLLTSGLDDTVSNSVGALLHESLSSDEYNSFVAISAFVSKAAIDGLEEKLLRVKNSYDLIQFIVGVDQKVTTKEALEAILSLEVSSFIFYHTGSTIFHPKVYLFESPTQQRLIVGSSNLTLQGLFSNVESSVVLDFSSSVEDARLFQEIKNQIPLLLRLDDPNLQPLTSQLIQKLVEDKVVPTESDRKKLYEQVDPKNSLVSETEPTDFDQSTSDDILSVFPKRRVPRIPFEYRKSGSLRDRHKEDHLKAGIASDPQGQYEETTGGNFSLVWRKTKMDNSSVEIPNSSSTNPTGGLRLVQAKYKVDGKVIDQTSYFRNRVFGRLNWSIDRSKRVHYEITRANFDVYILGNFIGRHLLQIRHKPSGEAGQGNYTTSISWGSLSQTIRAAQLGGKTLHLYEDINNQNVYKLEFI